MFISTIVMMLCLRQTDHTISEEMMKTIRRLILSALLFAAMTFAFTSLVQAQATRTWVSGVGDDANACSRTLPCKTFAGAIAKTVRGGEIDVLDAGGYGPVIITKSITIDGTGTMAAILGVGLQAISINITDPADTAKTVRIRGLSINGAGSSILGINVIAANKVSIEDTVIDGFIKDGVNIIAQGAQVFIKNTTIRNNMGAGINLLPRGSEVAISDVAVVFNNRGLSVGTGGNIISFKNNVIYGNKNNGAPTSSPGLQ